MFDLLAILGRGIQRAHIDGPWVLTEDIELCDERYAHLPVQVSADDDNPYCMVGGGKLNLEAGIELMYQYRPEAVVCAYGDRSDYLKSINGPTESEVMSEALQKDHGIRSWRTNLLEIIVWPSSRSMPGPSNTCQELKNIFDLAIDRKLEKIAVVTVGVHVPRTATYVARHLSVHEKWRHLRVTVLESEEVLLRHNEKQRPRVETLRSSKSFARNWQREANGISQIIRDVYGDAKPLVTKS